MDRDLNLRVETITFLGKTEKKILLTFDLEIQKAQS